MQTLRVEKINKYYGKQRVLHNINFTLKRGEITGFLGPNGAGKTTTMKIISGYTQNWNGTVYAENQDIKKNPQVFRKQIGYLPEHNPIEEQFYVKEYLNYVASIYLPIEKCAKAVVQVLEKVALDKESHKKIGQLSKGYKQRVGLAQALIHNPSILILDEPTTGLDPKQLEVTRKLIREECKDKIVLFSTHIMQEVEALCDRTLILNKGQIVSDSQNTKSFQRVRITFLESLKSLALPFSTTIQPLSNNCFLITSNIKEDIRPLLFTFAKKNNLTLVHLSEEKEDITQFFSKTIK